MGNASIAKKNSNHDSITRKAHMRTRRVNSELLPGKKNEVQVDTLFPPLWIFESTVLFGYVVYNAVWLLLYVVIFVLLFVAILMPTNDAPFLSSKKD